MNEFESGLENRRRILGEEWVEKSLGTANALNAEFQTLITRHAWHDVWNRNHSSAFDDKTRRLLVLAITLGLGRYEEFALHVRAGLTTNDASKLTIDDLRELVVQGAAYCGVPAANTAMHAIANVLKDIGQTPPKLHVIRHGDVSAERPTIVFSHALGYDHSMWDAIIPSFSNRYPLIAYDHRGQGKSEKSATDFSIDALVDDAASVILNEVFAKGGGPVHFVGLSMGGMVAQGLAARYPHLVKSIVVANSAMLYDDTAKALWRARIDTVNRKGMSAVVDMALARWFGEAFRSANPTTVAEVTRILLANDALAYARTCAAISEIDFSKTNLTISCPTLVIAGTRDEATPPALSDAIAASIPNARLATIDAAHISAIERPREFVELLINHLEY
ncbi:MAG: alpha/beta fold hydrolase [Casimicrobium sp.]